MKTPDWIRIVLSIVLVIGMWMDVKWCLYLIVTLCAISVEVYNMLARASLNRKQEFNKSLRKEV